MRNSASALAEAATAAVGVVVSRNAERAVQQLLICAPAVLALAFFVTPVQAQDLTIESVQQAEFDASANQSGERSALMLKTQILLDRARFSPGVIDGIFGANVSQAIAGYEKHNKLEADGELDQDVWDKLTGSDSAPALKRYMISQDDVDGPFVEEIPGSFADMAKLDRLAYTGPEELLAEKFHMDQGLLRSLNPDVDFGRAGSEIVVADTASGSPQADVARVEVDKGEKAVRAYTSDDTLVAFYPATIGSEGNPAPAGEFEVRAVASDPAYYYNPDDLSFQGVDVEGQVKIAPGPNNPVGTVWIDLTKDSYGLHGAPEPALIGKTFSHGCIRLTNWDATELSRMVGQGTIVQFLGS